MHFGFIRGFAAFFLITFCTGGNYIGPAMASSPGFRNDMINGRILSAVLAAVLTKIFVADKNVIAMQGDFIFIELADKFY